MHAEKALGLTLVLALTACFSPDDGGDDEVGDETTAGTDGATTSTDGGDDPDTSESTTTDTGSDSSDSGSESETTASETDTAMDTTDGPAAECGNGIVEGDEVCDDGPTPELAPGACIPDCSGVIETKTVARSQVVPDGSFGANPVAFADSTCEPGYKAMFAFGAQRQATTTPWASEGSIDWPVQPWTAYETNQGELVWVTDDVALIGVRDGGHQDVLANMGSGGCFGNPPICFFYSMLSGMEANGTTVQSNTCNGWVSASENNLASVGSFATGEYLTGTIECTFGGDLLLNSYAFLCVEQ